MIYTLLQYNQLTAENIRQLIENKVPEGKYLDYKEQLNCSNYEDKKELLGDISAFANAEGGIIIWGIKEDKGVPVELTPIEMEDPDKIVQSIENTLRDSIEPRLQGVRFKYVPVEGNKYFFLSYIPQSFNPPHVVKTGSHWRFYSRNSAGKYPLEVSELKTIISLSSSVRERIRNFRLERISKIKNHDLPIPITDGPQFVYHIVPLSAFSTDSNIDIARFEQGSLRNELFYGYTKIFNYEGILIHNQEGEYPANIYIQIFRNGAIEFFQSTCHSAKEKIIYRNSFEGFLIDRIHSFVQIQNYFEIEPSFLLFHSILNIRGYKIKLSEHEHERALKNRPITENDLLLSEIIIDQELLSNIPLTLKPLFDPIWNAAGHPQSPNFDQNGEWIPGKNK